VHWLTLNNGASVRYAAPDDTPFFPATGFALKDPAGLIQMGGALTPDWLLAAYQRGIFPWFSSGDPILWWCPDPRTILIPNEFNLTRSLAKVIRNGGFTVTYDTAFHSVIDACAYTRDETWIMPEMIAGYKQLHQQGHAHSVEVWLDDELVGGLYGIALGKIFFGESMFAKANNASKVALATLCQQLIQWDFQLIDCQFSTTHLLSLGAKEISRHEFLTRLDQALSYPEQRGNWRDLNSRTSNNSILRHPRACGKP
jgi:leucyl/phenylalanyl-tRNA--protein transferase